MKKYPKMKDSGVEWIGEVPEGWVVKKLKYLGKIKYGLGQPPPQKENGIPLIRATNVERGKIVEKDLIYVDPNEVPYERDPVLKTNDIIIVRSGAYTADSAIIPPKFEGAITGYDMVFRAQNCDAKYIAFALLSPLILERQLLPQTLRAAQPHLNREELGETIFILPSDRSEQTAVVVYLENKTAQINQSITEKERLIELFREERQAIINQAVTKGIRAGVKMKPTGVEWIEEVPEGWAVVALKRRCDIIDCKHVTPIYSDEGIPIVSPGDLKPYSINLNGSRKITEEQFRELTEGGRMPSTGDIIYSRNASVGSAAFIDGRDIFCMGQDVCLIRSTYFEPKYLEVLLNSHFVVEQLQSIMVGSTFKRINISQIRDFQLLVPPTIEQSEILVYLKSKTAQIDTAISGIQREIALLQEYRQALIFEAVTGKIDVRETA